MSGHEWKRSSRCAEGDSCVYFTTAPGDHVLVAGSPRPEDHRVLRVSSTAWVVLLDGIRRR